MKFYDFIIIGSGPAGSLIAWLLSKKKYKICLLDRSDDKKTTLNPYVEDSSFDYLPLFSNKLGGNSELWHNKIFLLSPDEFSKKKWKFSYEEINRFNLKLQKKLGIPKNLIKCFSKAGLNVSQSMRFNFNNVFDYFDIKNNKNIDIIKDSCPKKIYTTRKGIVKKIDIVDSKKKVQTLLLKKSIILTAGGLGNSHLILNLFNSFNKSKINFADHPHIKIGDFKNGELEKLNDYKKYYLTNKSIEKNIYEKRERTFGVFQIAIFSPEDFVRNLLKKIHHSKHNFMSPLYIFLMRIYHLFYKVINFCKRITLNRKYCLEFSFSQNKNSGVINLNKKLDKFGLRKININWKVLKKDKKNYYLIIKKSLKKLKLNSNFNFSKSFENVYVGQHPSCSTPITHKKKIIGVNKNLKLNGYKNVFTLGSNVFPENGFTNPTWTIMTLSLRLSKYLSKSKN